MGLILAATTGSGLLASKVLLEAGLSSVLLRYPLAVLAAYVSFLGMTWLWIRYTLVGRPSRSSLSEETAETAFDLSSGSDSGSATWSPSGNFDFHVDFDDGIWILVALAAVILAIFGAGAYLVWAAPEILPEIAVGALLASSLKRSAQRAESRGWLRSVLSCTAIPFGVVLLFVCVLAYAIHRTCPGAPKLLDALHCAGRGQ